MSTTFDPGAAASTASTGFLDNISDAATAGWPIGVAVVGIFLVWRIVKRFAKG